MDREDLRSRFAGEYFQYEKNCALYALSAKVNTIPSLYSLTTRCEGDSDASAESFIPCSLRRLSRKSLCVTAEPLLYSYPSLHYIFIIPNPLPYIFIIPCIVIIPYHPLAPLGQAGGAPLQPPSRGHRPGGGPAGQGTTRAQGGAQESSRRGPYLRYVLTIRAYDTYLRYVVTIRSYDTYL